MVIDQTQEEIRRKVNCNDGFNDVAEYTWVAQIPFALRFAS